VRADFAILAAGGNYSPQGGLKYPKAEKFAKSIPRLRDVRIAGGARPWPLARRMRVAQTSGTRRSANRRAGGEKNLVALAKKILKSAKPII